MESYSFLLFLAIIMISTKVLGLFSRKIHMPAVVGALAAGVILGPSGFWNDHAGGKHGNISGGIGGDRRDSFDV